MGVLAGAGGGVLLAGVDAHWSRQNGWQVAKGGGEGPSGASVSEGDDQLAAAVAGDDQMVVVRE